MPAERAAGVRPGSRSRIEVGGRRAPRWPRAPGAARPPVPAAVCGVIRSRSVFDESRCRPAGSRATRSAAATRSSVVGRCVLQLGEQRLGDLGRRPSRTACCPSRSASRTSSAAPLRGRAGPRAAPGPSRAASSSFGGCPRRPALRQPADHRVGDGRVGVGQRGDDRADRIDRRRRGRSARRRSPATVQQLRRRLLRGRQRPQEVLAVLRGGGGGGVGDPAVVRVLGPAERLDDRRRRPSSPAADRPAPAAPSAGPAGRGRAVSPASRIASTDFGVARQHLHRVAAHAGRGVLQGRDGDRGRLGVRAVERAQAVQRPQGVDRPDVQADLVDARVA